MDVEPKKAWWRRKRWIAVAMIWLLAVYPLLRGPMEYAATRAMVPRGLLRAVYGPLDNFLPRYGEPYVTSQVVADPFAAEPNSEVSISSGEGTSRARPRSYGTPIFERDPHPLGSHYRRYIEWWAALAYRHEHADDPPIVIYVPITR